MISYTVSNKVFDLIKNYETGLGPDGRLLPLGEPALATYLDDANKLTIGWGHTRTAKLGDTITREQAEILFAEDIARIVSPQLNEIAAAHDLIGCSLAQHQIDAFAALAFNVGSVKTIGPDSWQALLKGNFDRYLVEASEIEKITKADDTKVRVAGLGDRRADEAELFVKGDYSRSFDNTAGNPGRDANPYVNGNFIGNEDDPQVPKDWQIKDCIVQNVILAIDLSGSMGDDLESVKASALTLIESLFGSDAAPIASRLGIVTFNDTDSIQIALPFTDHADVASRKAAAISAINGLEILGGGDEPLNGALLTALTGGLGPWGDGANKLVVFSDEPAADPELRAMVLEKAKNLNANLPGQEQNFELAASGSLAEFPQASSEVGASVQIFPVLIGSSSSARSDFAELSEQTGGQLFQALDAIQAANVLISAIQSSEAATQEDDFFELTPGISQLNGLQGTDIVFVDVAVSDLELSEDFSGNVILEYGTGTTVILDSIEFVLGNNGMLMVSPPQGAEFSDAYYKSLYADVAAAVNSGRSGSGIEHYLTNGLFEGRVGKLPFDENYYLSENPDVAAAIETGRFSSGKEHFILNGNLEGRDPVALFDTNYYLDQNSDVTASVAAGAITAFDHFLLHGNNENRRPSILFSEEAYYGLNADVGLVGVDAFTHLFTRGVLEERVISDPGSLGI